MSLTAAGQVLADVPPLQDVTAEEAQRRNLRDDRPDRESAFLNEKQVVASELDGRNAIEPRARVLAKRVNDLEVAPNGGRGVVATDELVAQVLQ
jgi:hypothetical protein